MFGLFLFLVSKPGRSEPGALFFFCLVSEPGWSGPGVLFFCLLGILSQIRVGSADSEKHVDELEKTQACIIFCYVVVTKFLFARAKSLLKGKLNSTVVVVQKTTDGYKNWRSRMLSPKVPRAARC